MTLVDVQIKRYHAEITHNHQRIGCIEPEKEEQKINIR